MFHKTNRNMNKDASSFRRSVCRIQAASGKLVKVVALLCLFIMAPYSYSLAQDDKSADQTAEPTKKKATTINVKGRVTDDDGGALPGVSVVINGTTRGVVTDVNGRYEILVRSDGVLNFSFIGFDDRTVPVEGKQTINIRMHSNSKNIKEVTVVAFGKQKKESVVGSITTVNPGDLKTSNSDLTASFVGRIPGMIGYQKGGLPAALTEGEMNTVFNIRGVTSFGSNANTAPLILMDNVEVSVLELSRIDPEDIETFSVLKDAAATAMYGARGANGVILVTTKKGQEGSAYTTGRYECVISEPTQKIDVVDPITYMKAYNEALVGRGISDQPAYSAERIANTGSNKYPSWVYPANDWYKTLFKNRTVNHRAGVNVRGGTNVMQYYASLSYDYNEGMLKTDKLNQFDVNIKNNTYALRLNLNINLTPTSRLNFASNSSLDDYHGPSVSVQQAYQMAFNASPVNYAAVYPADANYAWPHIHFGVANSNSVNPYAQIQSGYNDVTRYATSNVLEFQQNFGEWIKGLEAYVQMSYYKQSYELLPYGVVPFYYRLQDYNAQTGEHTLELVQQGRTDLRLNPTGKQVYGSTQFAGQLRVEYNGVWGDHNITYTGVGSFQQDASSAGSDLWSTIKHRNLSLSSRLSYGYKERYYLEYSFGYNGSERFAKEKRFGYFPAYGLAWNIHKEPWFKKALPYVSYLKFRFSYGKVGNDGIGNGTGFGNTGRYVYLPNIGQNSQNQYVTYSYANPYIQWEVAEQTNFGLDFTLFGGLIDVTAEAFQEIRHNILSQRVVVPATMGLGLYPYANIGKGRSRGFDVKVKIQKQFNKDFYFILNSTFSYSKSIYLELEEGADKPAWQSRIGHDISQQIGYIAEGLFQSQEEIDRSPVQQGGSNVMPGDIKYRDINGDGKIDNLDAVYIGYPTMPRFVYGFQPFVHFKGWELSMAFQGSGDRSLFMNPLELSPFSGQYSGDHALLTKIWEDHWTPDNMDTHPFWPRLNVNNIYSSNPEEAGTGQESRRFSTYFMRPVRFLRCQQIQLAYRFPDKWIHKLGLQRVMPYVTVDNPFIISSFHLWDVELGSSGFNYPIQRTYSIGLNISF